MPRAAVIGAGIAGLAAAYHLSKSGVNVTVFEAASRVGGVIRSERVDGYLVEHGPNSVQSRSVGLEEIISELHLESRRVEASDASKVRYVVRNGVPVGAPTSPPALFSTRLFSSSAKLRLLREPFISRGAATASESVADFVRRRLGKEVLDYGMNPFVAGVFAGDPERLSMKHSFPQLVELEQRYGSIIRGKIKRRHTAPGGSRKMFSFDEGLEVLPLALASALGEKIVTDARVSSVTHLRGSWQVAHPRGTDSFDAILYCAPLHRLTDISLPFAGEAQHLATVTYPPLSVIAFGYRRRDVGHPLNGFGLLVPDVERKIRVLGTLFTSSIFPERAPAGEVLLTSFVGGMRSPDLAEKEKDELFDIAHEDLRLLLNASSSPIFRRHVFWKHSIPQYLIGYDDVLETIGQMESKLPGWFMAGNYRSGIAVGDAASSGLDAAQRCISLLSSRSAA